MTDDRRDEKDVPHAHIRPHSDDERIAADISALLAEDTDVDTTEVEVTVEDGTVTLAGSVGGRMARERVEELADSVTGVRDVSNDLKVRPAFARSFEDAPDLADAAVEEPRARSFAVSDVSGSDWGTGAASDNRPGTGLDGGAADDTDPKR